MRNNSKTRQQVIKTAVAMSSSALSPGRSGNVSARIDGGFLITPSALAYEDLGPEDIVFVQTNGFVPDDQRPPSSEWRFHQAIYNQYAEAGAIVHCHSRHATALACANMEIPPFHYMVAAAGGQKIPLAPYALFGSEQLSDHVVAALDGYKATLMAHHGQVAYGKDLAAALELAGEVEDLAAQYILVRTLGSDAVLSDEKMNEVVERFKTYGKPVEQAS